MYMYSTCKFNVYMYIILSTIKWICKHVYSFNKNMKNAWYTVLIINCKKNIYIYIYTSDITINSQPNYISVIHDHVYC